MRRIIIDAEEHQGQRENVLAQLDDVSNEAFVKKFMKKAEDGTLPDDNRTLEEIQKEEAAMNLEKFLSWCDLEEEVNLEEIDDPSKMLTQIAQEMTEGSKEALELAEKQRIDNIEYDASEKIKQVTEFTVDTEDPLNIQEYKEKKEKVIAGLLQMSQKSEQQKENEKTYQRVMGEDTSYRFRSSGFTSRVNLNEKQYKSKRTNRETVIDADDLDAKKRAYWDNLDDDKNMAYQAAVDGKGYRTPDDRPANYKKLFAGKKFRFKNMWHNVKAWLRTNKAKAITKFGIMVSFEMMMAILAGKREFDGNGQMLAYLGMIMGAFIIGNELIKEGYDPRKIQFD
jgi:hypothetical protein